MGRSDPGSALRFIRPDGAKPEPQTFEAGAGTDEHPAATMRGWASQCSGILWWSRSDAGLVGKWRKDHGPHTGGCCPMYRPLDLLLRRIVRTGDLTLIDSQGVPQRYGDGGGPPIVVRIADKRLEWRLLLDPHLALGEGYMNGQLRMERGQVYDLLALLARNVQQRPAPNWTSAFDAARFLMRRIMQFNPIARARRNVARYYDIDGAIYDLFLDRDRQYSCGYFTDDIAGL